MLARLRAGESAMRIARSLAVHHRRIAAIARANGIAMRRRRTVRELAAQDGLIRRLRGAGRSWTQVAEALGYGPDSGRIAVRNRARRAGLDAAPCRNAKSARSLLRALRRLVPADWEDLASFVDLARNPDRHWLLTERELDLARRRRLLPPDCMRVPSRALGELSQRRRSFIA